MKKLTSVCLVLCMMISLFAFAANAADTINVRVTIVNKAGELVVAAETVKVRDVDNDRKFTVHDTLTCAHEQFYGSADGYEAVDSLLYGLGITKLWGESDGGGFGYYCNDISCWSLRDEVKAEDRVTAFVYPENWSATHYSFCVPYEAAVKTGETLKLTVKEAGYDPTTWEPIELPVVGATITVDGKATRSVTDENGKAEILILKPGEHVVSVTSDKEILVPFAVRVQVSFNVISFVQGLYRTIVNWVTNLISK